MSSDMPKCGNCDHSLTYREGVQLVCQGPSWCGLCAGAAQRTIAIQARRIRQRTRLAAFLGAMLVFTTVILVATAGWIPSIGR